MILSDRDPWKSQSKCKGIHGAVFFPSGHLTRRPTGHTGAWTREEMEQEAAAICKGDEDGIPCPVIAECLGVAMSNGEISGVWGGTTEAMRRHMRNNLSAQT